MGSGSSLQGAFGVNGKVMSAKPRNGKLTNLSARTLFLWWIATACVSAQTKGPVGELVAQLTSSNPQVRKAALAELERIGSNDKTVVTALAAALSDPDVRVRLQASEALKDLGAAASPAINELIAALGSRVMGVPGNAQQALVAIGPQTIPTLIDSLGKIPEQARSRAVWVLGYLGEQATPALIEAMNDDQADVRIVAIRAIIEMGDRGQRAVPALVHALGDSEEDVRESAAAALGRIGTKARSAAPALTVALRDSAWSVRREAAGALARVGPDPSEAIPALESASKNDAAPEVRAAAASAIVSVARSVADRYRAVVDLIVALEDKDPKVRKAAASALGTLGPEAADAVGPLTALLLKDPDRHMRSWAADALGEIGPAARSAVPSLIAGIKDSDPWLRRIAAEALGRIGSASDDIISTLIIAQRDPAETAREGALSAMVTLAERSARAGDYAAIEPLKRASSALKSGDPRTHSLQTIERFEEAIDSLAAKERADWPSRIMSLIAHHPVTVTLVALAGLYLTWLAILRLAILKIWPVRVLKWSRALSSRFEVELPDALGKRKFSLRTLVLAGFENHPLVLDAWVARHAGRARDRFLRAEPVHARSTYVPIPLFVDGKLTPALDTEAVAPIRARDRWSIVILGEDGLGKSTLAYQFALWGLSDSPAGRLCPDVQMLPVLIESESAHDVCNDTAAFGAAVVSKLQELIEPVEPIADEFVERLLRTRRILVLLDGATDMDSDTESSTSSRTLFSGGLLPALALVITTTAQVPDPTILVEPQRLDRNHLLPFVSAYLARANLAGLPDATIYQVCARLAELAGPDRGVTPLLARKLVEEVVAAVRAGRSPLDLTASLPELMLSIESNRLMGS
jgi:HEAT repeat protein